MNNNVYMTDLLKSFLSAQEDNIPQLMLIKHYNSFQLSLEESESAVGAEYFKGLFYHHFERNYVQEPYEPFLNCIRYLYRKFFSEETVEEFIEHCDVYALHKDLFVSYFKTGCAKRKEFVILSELKYEKGRMIQSIRNCLNYIGKKQKVFLILNNLQFASLSTIQLLTDIIREEDYHNYRFLLICNEKQHAANYVRDAFLQLIELMEEKKLAYDWYGTERQIGENYHSVFVPNKRGFAGYIQKFSNLSQMLAMEDADYYMQIIHGRIMQDKFDITKTEKFRFYSLYAYNNVYCDNTKTALWMCERLSGLFCPGKDAREEFVYNYLVALIQIARIQSDLAMDYIRKCQNIAKFLEDADLIFYSKLLEHAAEFDGWKDAFSVVFENVRMDCEFVQELRNHNFDNTLAYYLVSSSDNDIASVSRIVNDGFVPERMNEAIAIGKRLDNQTFLLYAYTKCIVVYSQMGFLRYINRFYQEKLKLTDDTMIEEKAHLLMGMGYNETVCEEYPKANEYLNQALSMLYSVKDAEGIAECLYNLAMNGISSRDFHSATEYLNTIFTIVNHLGFETIRICNASKLQGLLALCYYMEGNLYRSSVYLNQVQMLIGHVLYKNDKNAFADWEEDLFLYYFVKGLLLSASEEYEKAYQNFKKAESFFNQLPGIRFYAIVDFTVEYYLLCTRLKKTEEAQRILEEADTYCNKHEFIRKNVAIKTLIENRDKNVSFWTNRLENITIPQMIEVAKNAGTALKLEERKKDIHFLVSWQELINKEDIDEHDLLHNAASMLLNNFNLDGMFIFKCQNKTVYSIYQSGEDALDSYQIMDIYRFFDTYKKEFIISRTDRNFMEYKKIISILGSDKVVTVIGIPLFDETGMYSIMLAYVNIHKNFQRNLKILNEEHLLIMKTIFVQLGNDLERIRNKKRLKQINNNLNELVNTDMLTGLYNRQGMSKHLEEYLEDQHDITILYADLDNFKYYNDTFGHDIGDVVLVEFSKLLKNATKKEGLAVRYGGDEFLIIVKDKDSEAGVQIAEEIYRGLENGFQDIVSLHLRKNVEIPKEKKLSCSIGIATAKARERISITETLRRADEALYYIKRNGKNRYIVWENIHEDA